MIGLVDILEDYEAGYLEMQQTLELFAELIRTERVWYLGDSYPSTARHLISAGYITSGGKITNKGYASILEDGREGSPCDANPETDEASDDSIPGPFAVPNVKGGGAA